MTTRLCRGRAVVLALLLLGSSASAAFPATQAQQSQSPQQQQPAQQQPAQQPQAAPSSGAADLFSIDRIRRELERQPALTFTMPDPNLPIYRLRVEGQRFQLGTWQQNFVLPRSSVPVPLGGSDYYTMQQLFTPESVRAVQNRDVLGMVQAQAQTALAIALIKKALAARKDAAPARARAEVQQELADIAAHNARVAAGQADPDPADAKKATEKKKQDEEKKKQDGKKKEKKDDGRK